YLNPSLIFWMALSIVPTVLLLARTEIVYSSFVKEQLRRFISIAISLGVVGIIALFFYKDYASVGRNNSYLRSQIIPTYYINSLYKYVKQTHFTQPITYTEIGLDAKRVMGALETKPTLTVLVLGETARSASQSLNGYPRETNRYTQDWGMLSFKDVSACGTATALSVPCMFSNFDRANYDERLAKNQDNVLDIIQRAGVDVTWIENDGGCKGVCDKVPTINIKPEATNPYCDGKVCYDEVFLPLLDQQFAQQKGKNQLIVLHVIGSHGPTYYLRYPAEQRLFTPDCQRSDIENCSAEQLINTYDNTIAYTDFVISKVINKLNDSELEQKYNTNLLYISDHGESLGESGLYLHGTPYRFAPDYQTKVPLMLWMSQAFVRERGVDLACLKGKTKQKGYSHDNLFSTLLAITGVETAAANQVQNILGSCQ
ncbi:MAG: phosphoethanolamine transferase, partial [Enterovibrio sp.]